VIAGTGFFVAEEQYLVTAAHVLSRPQEAFHKENASDITFNVGIPLKDHVGSVTLRLGFLDSPFEVLDLDAERDLALLRLPKPIGPKGVHVKADIPEAGRVELTSVRNAPLSPDPVFVGQEAAVAGFALSLPYLVVQQGIVSSLPVLPLQGTPREIEPVVLDITVNPGNSGGPIFLAENGKVIGVCQSHQVSPVLDASFQNTPLLQHAGLSIAVPIRFVMALLEKHSVQWNTNFG
jgi:serine protease Do